MEVVHRVEPEMQRAQLRSVVRRHDSTLRDGESLTTSATDRFEVSRECSMRMFVAALLVASIVSGDSADAGGRSRRSCRAHTLCQAPSISGCQTPLIGGVTEFTRTREVTSSKSVDCQGNSCRVRTVSVTDSGSVTRPSSVAQWKADQLAARGQLVHLGGGFGGGSHEGIGFGATAEQATQACCFWGQREPIEIGVAQGSSGYYAVVLYR